MFRYLSLFCFQLVLLLVSLLNNLVTCIYLFLDQICSSIVRFTFSSRPVLTAPLTVHVTRQHLDHMIFSVFSFRSKYNISLIPDLRIGPSENRKPKNSELNKLSSRPLTSEDQFIFFGSIPRANKIIHILCYFSRVKCSATPPSILGPSEPFLLTIAITRLNYLWKTLLLNWQRNMYVFHNFFWRTVYTWLK